MTDMSIVGAGHSWGHASSPFCKKTHTGDTGSVVNFFNHIMWNEARIMGQIPYLLQ